MSDNEFAVVFKGQLVEGADPAQVRAKLAKLFNADAARVEAMFSGKTVIVKKGIDEDTAKQYKAVLAKAGAVALVARTGNKAQESAKQAQVEVAKEPAAAVPPTVDASTSAQAEPPAADTSAPEQAPAADESKAQSGPPEAIDATIAEPGVILVEYKHLEAPDIDTSHLDVAEVGVDLVEYKTVEAPEFDLSGLTLDAPGPTLAEPRQIVPPEIDTSSLSLEEN